MHTDLSAILAALIGALILPIAPAEARWPDTAVARLEILTHLQTLNAALLSRDSATLTLDDWCAQHRLADGQKIVADKIKGEVKEAPAEVRAGLRVGSDEPLAYRRVKLRCGARVLSEADNWYVPSRLTPEMNQTLEATDTAFGRVVAPLGFQRHTVSARLLWSPLPSGWDTDAQMLPPAPVGSSIAIPDGVIEHRAMLTRSDGEPFSYVIETYQGAALDFPPSGLFGPAVGRGASSK